MTQLFNLSVGGVDITDRHVRSSISEAMNRVYDVATVVIDATSDAILESEIIINYGGKTFTGFIYAVNKIGKNTLQLECRTNSAKLTEPYSPRETVFDDATTSTELCALYAASQNVPITLTSEALNFGGSYERNGTMLSALQTVANITGAEYYDDICDSLKC